MSLADSIVLATEQTWQLYEQLVLVVAPSGTGKTPALQEVARRVGAPRVNVNLELSRRLLELTEKQRALRGQRVLGEILANVPGDLVLLDNLEMLFDVSLQQDPLRLLRSVSRNRTVVASWNGAVSNGQVTYADPGHPEHRRYDVSDILVVTAE